MTRSAHLDIEGDDGMETMVQRLKEHWPEYLMEAAELGAFMISAALVTSLLYHPSSPASHVVTGAPSADSSPPYPCLAAGSCSRSE